MSAPHNGTENARIDSTFFGIEDHGILTFFVQITADGLSQGLGGYGLDNFDAAGWNYRAAFDLPEVE